MSETHPQLDHAAQALLCATVLRRDLAVLDPDITRFLLSAIAGMMEDLLSGFGRTREEIHRALKEALDAQDAIAPHGRWSVPSEATRQHIATLAELTESEIAARMRRESFRIVDDQ